MDIQEIQKVLEEYHLDAWLFCDIYNRDPLAYRVLGLDFGKFTTRRWFYFIPQKGEPIGLVHRVEPTKLDALPGKKIPYLGWQELHKSLQEVLGSPKRIAMQYSPMHHIPNVSMVDAGLVELVRSFGHEVVSSADLIQYFVAVISEQGYQMHCEASRYLYQIKDEAFQKIRKALQTGQKITEYEIQQFIVQRFEDLGLDCMNEFPIVGVNEHPANPHFEPTRDNTYFIKKGDTILIDLWAKLKKPGAVFADITWCGYCGSEPPRKYVEIFNVVKKARDQAIAFIRERFSHQKPCYGWEVDQACRDVVDQAGYGAFFIHRTGHSIGETVHGNGVNMDNLETREERLLLPGICFSIEPGIYLEQEKMAVRTEVNVFITAKGEVKVTGEAQEKLVLLHGE